MQLTLIDADITGDARFPAWDGAEWLELSREHRSRDDKNAFDVDFVCLVRR
jgi:dihydrofolate reductase